MIHLTTSAIILRIHSNALYLFVTKARSRATGFFYLSNDTNIYPPNGAIHILCTTMKKIMSLLRKLRRAPSLLIVKTLTLIRHTYPRR